MSFESYLNYDQVTNKRKRKAGSTGARPKKVFCLSIGGFFEVFLLFILSLSKPRFIMLKQYFLNCAQAKVTSLQELLNTPLPKFLTGISNLSTPCAADFTGKYIIKPVDVLLAASIAPVVEAPQQVSETLQFTGRRLNSKMQVYSGSKPACLSKMLTLYEQCIRVLQNNIDLIQEVGSVPFEILEPVLTRCTPEQLFRIEECNLAFIKESDHLWKKHCQREFKNENLLEDESWREMYLRLFNQREEKLKMLTKNILSAQSEKPKGRQVKMAYMTSAAKPPMNIRRQQKIHGTAGPLTHLHPIKKFKANSSLYQIVTLFLFPFSKRTSIPESKDRNDTSAGNIGSSSSGVMIQDRKKPIKRIAPIMKKTLKALKSRPGR
ncbi:ELOA1 protein, partial [Sclerurus mexicanus]|nr:ELOA1 protein [Sclerurus mexicanus]